MHNNIESIPVERSKRSFIPAAGRDLFLPLYDPFVKLLGGDVARKTLINQAVLQPGFRVLDIGCGTGTLVTLIKSNYPEVEVVGLDPDPKALSRARRKTQRASASVRFDQGFSDELPYSDASFDRVFSSMMLHHLEMDEKAKTFKEIRRVLKPGATLHLVDFTGPDDKKENLLAHWFHSSHHLVEHTEKGILNLMTESRLENPTIVKREKLFFMPIVYFRASI